MSRIKELGDPTKILLGIGRNRFGNRGKFGLKFKGPVVRFDQQQGNIPSFPWGRGYPKYHRVADTRENITFNWKGKKIKSRLLERNPKW